MQFRPYNPAIDGPLAPIQPGPDAAKPPTGFRPYDPVTDGPLFDFKAASRVHRKLNDQTEREKQFGTMGPVQGPAPTVSTVARGLVSDVVTGARRARAGVRQAVADVTGFTTLADSAKKEIDQASLTTAINTPAFESDTARGVYGGLSSTLQMAAPVAAAVATRNPSVAMTGLVAPMAADQYGKFRQRGATPGQAAIGAAGTAGVEYLTEKTPMGFLVNTLGRAGTGKLIAGFVARDAPLEQVATLTQDAIDTAIANPNKTWGEYLAERPQAAYQTLVSTATQAGVMGAANAAIEQASPAARLARALDADAQSALSGAPAPATPQPIAQVVDQLANVAPQPAQVPQPAERDQVLSREFWAQGPQPAQLPQPESQPTQDAARVAQPADQPQQAPQEIALRSTLAARLLAMSAEPGLDAARAQQLQELAMQAQAAADNPAALVQQMAAGQALPPPENTASIEPQSSAAKPPTGFRPYDSAIDGPLPRTSVSAIEKALQSAYGDLPSKLSSSVSVVQSEQDAIDAAVQARIEAGATQEEALQQVLSEVRSAQGATGGFFDPQTRRSLLIADSLTPQTAPGVFMHEAGVHLGSLPAVVTDRARALATQGQGEFFNRVRARMKAAGVDSAQESAAYLVEEFENDRTAAPKSVKAWVQRLKADFRASRANPNVADFDASDIAAAARLAAKNMASANTQAPANGALDFSRASPASVNQPWTVLEPGATDNIIRSIQNNKIDLKRVRDSIDARYGSLTDTKDAYLNEELYHGRVAARVDRLYDDHVNPLLRKIAVAGKNVGVTIDDVNTYLHARHAPERNAAMQAINPGMQDNQALSGMSDAEAAAVLSAFAQSNKGQALRQIAADVDRLLEDTRTALVADGLEDADVVAAWESAYKHYVPLQRDVASGGAPRGSGFSIRGPESRRAVGSNREVVNIMANIVAQAETAAIRAEKSIVGRSLLEMARAYPNPDFWRVDQAPTKPRIDEQTGLVLRDAVDPMYQTADNVVMVKDYGGVHFVVFNKDSERAMATAAAMKNLGVDQMPKWLQIAGKGTRFLASLLTARNPEFWLTNFTRDIQGALINLDSTQAAGLQTKVMANLPKAFAGMRNLVRGDESTQWSQYARELTEAGGTTGYMQSFDTSDMRMDDLRAEVAKMQQGAFDPRRLGRVVLDFVDDYNNVIEGAVRLSVFQAARDAGVSTPRAASIAKNISVNFNRKGNASTSINALYMFFNASVQSTARMAQAVATSRRTQAVVGALAGIGFALDMINRLIAGDDEETGRNRYDLIPEFEKTRNWIFMNPARPGEYVKVPLPLGFHLFPNAGRLLSDAINRKDSRNAAEYGMGFAGMVLDTFSPLGTGPSVSQFLLPSLADPVVQVAENKSFTGAPVYKSADKGFGQTDPKPAYTRHFESTPDTWKAVSKMLNDLSGGDNIKPGAIDVEPDILKHVFYTLTGGPGRALDKTIDATQAEARGQDVSVNRLPIAGRFYGENDDKQRERVFYDQQKKAAETKAAYDYFNKNDRRTEANKIATELGDGDPKKGVQLMREYARTGKSISAINKKIRQELEKDAPDPNALRSLRDARSSIVSDTIEETED